jgi:two-component system nitrogen regulation sensor histidine kinase NtrY
MFSTITADPERTGGLFRFLPSLSCHSLIALGVALAAVISGVGTYLSISGFASFRPTSSAVVVWLLIDLCLVLALGALIAWRLSRLWVERRQGAAGARLHVRLVVTFGAIAVVPAILVAIFAAVSLDLGIEAWFSDRVKTALDNAVSVADAYVEEHKQVIRGDVLAMAFDLNRQGPLLLNDQKEFRDLLVAQAAIRALPAVYIVDASGRFLASTVQEGFLKERPKQTPPAPEEITEANSGKMVIKVDKAENVISALVKLDAFVNAYLFVQRNVDPVVLEHQRQTHAAVSEYQRLTQNRSEFQLVFAALYVVVSLLILLGATGIALWAADRIVKPIGRLAGAAELVSEGDLGIRVAVGKDDDEISSLSETFNRMTSQLQVQRNQLVETNRLLDSRRRFTEAMLDGVSAGVIGIESEGYITLINPTAARMLAISPDEVHGRHYSEIVPELADLVSRAMTEPAGRTAGQADMHRDGILRHLNVQVSHEAGGVTHGLVVTFDDISDLVSAQRTAAWAEVARRIAHEIKNPLTPIQLSAERLKRKYANEITSDPEVFRQCTDTIIRQVGDIGRMVDEFSSFARMPAPVIHREQAQELLRQAIFLQRVAHPNIAFEVTAPTEPIVFECDGQLVSQALINVLKNACEAIIARQATGDTAAGRIALDMSATEENFIITVSDNGIGLPKELRNRLTEPYVTTRSKGTGLGLAIVRKILEDHGGTLTLSDARTNGDVAPGAQIQLIFPWHQQVKSNQRVLHEQQRVGNRA